MFRAGELSAQELESLMVIVANPRTFKVPDWFLNRQKDHKDGRFSQVTSSALDTKLRDDLERLKKIRFVWPVPLLCICSPDRCSVGNNSSIAREQSADNPVQRRNKDWLSITGCPAAMKCISLLQQIELCFILALSYCG